jgi:hypothetical protein
MSGAGVRDGGRNGGCKCPNAGGKETVAKMHRFLLAMSRAIELSITTRILSPDGFVCWAFAMSGGKQFPVPLRDDFDSVADDFDGGLIVNRVRRYW